MPESVTGSNWDFTPVINLLHSHAYGNDGASGSPHHATEDGAPSSCSSEDLEPIGDFSDSCASEQKTHVGGRQTATPKLGDFGSLWEILSQGSGAGATASVSASQDDQDADTTPRALSPSVSNVKILKRPSDRQLASASATQVPPRTPPKSIPGPSSRSRHTKGKSTTAVLVRNAAQTGVKGYEASSSDNAEGESDGNVSIFDPPLSTKPGALSSPSRLDSHKNNNTLDDTPPSSFDELVGGFFTSEAAKKPSGNATYKSAKQRKAGLLAKLARDFPDCVGALTQSKQSLGPDAGDSIQPIHVFVDMSNIMVGFHDSFKLARNIPVETRIRRVPLSFQNFSLILERGRPATKRVLVGSDRFAAIDEGEKLGYEKNILDRVHKAKQLTQRQARYQSAASSSETNEAAVERWVEQGVDEILHLKILESLVDTDEPATIVLATGDAAEAEYSGGFMKMVERALQRGWTVELVSFTQVTSQAYQRKKFRAKWGDRFKMIALERYIEELLG